MLESNILDDVRDFVEPAKYGTEPSGFQPNLPHLDDNSALFVDIDGTLADIALTPDQAFIPSETLLSLVYMYKRSGAVAIVSGRALDSIDRLTKPYLFPAAGQHGLEIRHPNGRVVERAEGDSHTMTIIKAEVEALKYSYPQLLVEFKGLSVALHYREVPQLESVVTGFMKLMEKRHADICLQFGKMVGEIRMCGGNKGKSIEYFMRLAPFAGRRPIFIGDDITDQDGFIAVNQMAGISIQVGHHLSSAHYFVDSPQQVRMWLEANINKGAKR